MKVVISVAGDLYAFTLAEQLDKRDAFSRIFTTYPRFTRDTTLSEAQVESIWYPELIRQLGYQLPKTGGLRRLSQWNRPTERWCGGLFDRAVARRLQPVSDGIFLGFAGSCIRSLRRANELGFTTAVERASSHIRTQQRILAEEYSRFQAGSPPISDAHVAHEEREYQEADYVVTPSQFAYESFLDHGFEESRLFQIPFGTDIPTPSATSTEGDEPVNFLFVGTVDLRKGIQYLLAAWDRLELPDAELTIVGRTTDSARQVVDDYRDSSVQFVGWSDNPQEWYERGSVFVFPSLEEGSARVVYEAMAFGLPVITTFNSGWVGTDGEHGIEVPIRDPVSLADAMESLYADAARRRDLGASARSLMADRYTWDDYGDRVIDAYRSMQP